MDLAEFQKHGQSVWLDFIRRDLLTSGEFARLVRAGIRGVTTNPSIFEKGIAESTEYDSALERYVELAKDEPAESLYERLAVDDVQRAADVLRTVYDMSDRRDGYVCMEVSPHLAYDTQGTIVEARRLWARVQRENVMIKVPATPEGIPAIGQLTGEGINVNITLLFSREGCRQVFDAYMGGLEVLAQRGEKLGRIASVASMFVSRIDVMVDPLLEALATAAKSEEVKSLIGKVAIANAKLAYQDWKERCQSPRWQSLASQGARPQRLLWASTGTKDPRFSDVLYVEELIGLNTVDTIPPATLKALRDHGKAEDRLEQGIEDARQVMADLELVGISYDAIARRLLEEGVVAFSKSFDQLMAAIRKKKEDVLSRPPGTKRSDTMQVTARR